MIDSALQRRDSEFFRQRGQTEHVVCSTSDLMRTWEYSVCERIGQEYDGLNLVAWRSDASGRVRLDTILMMIESLWSEAVPGASDKYGDSGPRIYALGGQNNTAVMTALIRRPDVPASGPTRVVLVTHWQMSGNQWRFFQVLRAYVLAEDLLEPTDPGRRWVEGWERFRP